jgi:acetyl esterase/lipase
MQLVPWLFVAFCAALPQERPQQEERRSPTGDGQPSPAPLSPAPKSPEDIRKPMKYEHEPDLANIAYGPHERHTLDLWKAPSDKPAPLLIYYHPGGFGHGDKSWISPILVATCLERGISVATANYRYSSQAQYPASFEDSARALQFLRLHAREYHLDPQRVAVEGGSAGGIISFWIGFHDDRADPHSGDPVKRQSTRVSVIGAVDGVCSLDPRFIAKLLDEESARLVSRMALWQLFGLERDEDPLRAERAFPLFEDSSAINFIRAGAPPAFLYYHAPLRPLEQADRSERVHHIRHGLAIKQRMDQLHIECVVRDPSQYPGPDRTERIYRDMVEFFLKYL